MKDIFSMVGIASRAVTRLEQVNANMNGKFAVRVGLPMQGSAFETTIDAPGIEKLMKVGLTMGKGKMAEEIGYMQ